MCKFTCLLIPGHLARGHTLPLAKTHVQDSQLSILCPYGGHGPADSLSKTGRKMKKKKKENYTCNKIQ
jgi:hypothetical protein